MLSVTVVTHERERRFLGKLVLLNLYRWEDENKPIRAFAVQVRRDGVPLGERQCRTEFLAERRRKRIASAIQAGEGWDEIKTKHRIR